MTTDRSRRSTGQAHPVDVYVGARIKQRRIEMGMSQQDLGKLLHLTFQQVQKYERGANRVGSSRLHELSQALNTPVAYFFDEMPTDVATADLKADQGTPKMPDMGEESVPSYTEGSVLSRSETLRLVTYYYQVGSDAQRRAVYEMIKSMAEANKASQTAG